MTFQISVIDVAVFDIYFTPNECPKVFQLGNNYIKGEESPWEHSKQ